MCHHVDCLLTDFSLVLFEIAFMAIAVLGFRVYLLDSCKNLFLVTLALVFSIESLNYNQCDI